MEGCLYQKYDEVKYYLITRAATYTVIAVEFESFISCFIQNENFDTYFKQIEFNSTNIKHLLQNYHEFNDLIDYSNLNDFNTIIYNNKVYIIKNWKDVFNFAAGRF
jgi:hypothetical protein